MDWTENKNSVLGTEGHSIVGTVLAWEALGLIPQNHISWVWWLMHATPVFGRWRLRSRSSGSFYHHSKL